MPSVILAGDPAFYGRFGFGPIAAFGLANPFAGEIPEEDILIAALHAHTGLAGEMRWHPAFGQPG